jgi:uncharacterized protein (TIGR03066 family)
MNAVRLSGLALGCFVVVALTSLPSAAADKADNKTKIVGSWNVTKVGSDLPPEAVLVFSKDGKLKITGKVKDKTFTVEGTYLVDGDKLSVTLKGPDGKEHKETMTIKTLTDKKLVTKDDKGKEDEFAKK